MDVQCTYTVHLGTLQNATLYNIIQIKALYGCTMYIHYISVPFKMQYCKTVLLTFDYEEGRVTVVCMQLVESFS